MFNFTAWEAVEKGAFESSEVFLKPPFRSRQFLAGTTTVGLLLAFGVTLLARLWTKFPMLTIFFNFSVAGNRSSAMGAGDGCTQEIAPDVGFEWLPDCDFRSPLSRFGLTGRFKPLLLGYIWACSGRVRWTFGCLIYIFAPFQVNQVN